MPMKKKSYVENGLGPTEKDGRFCKIDPRVLFRQSFLINALEEDMSKTTVLTRDEEKALIEKYRDNRDKLKEELILHNTRAACSIAKRYARSTEDFEDLLARAMYGLVYAADKFDIDSGNRFLTYATNWIFNWIQREYYARGRKIFNDTTVSITQKALDCQEGELNPEDSLLHLVPENERERYMHQMESELTENDMLKIVQDVIDMVNDDGNNFDELDRAIFQQKMQKNEDGNVTTFKALSERFNVPVPVVKKRRDQLCERLRGYISSKYGVADITDII